MHLVTDCKASPDYRLWVKFDNGQEGWVHMVSLVDIGPFKVWRDVRNFLSARVADEGACIAWASGVRLDPEILYNDLEARKSLVRSVPPTRPKNIDKDFLRFMVRVLSPSKHRPKRGGDHK